MFIEEGAICFDCATKLHFKPVPHDVGVWMDDCVVCKEHKACTDASHDYRQRVTFSCCWSDELGEVIKARSLEDYKIGFSCIGDGGSMFTNIRDAVNQGIDSHLEAVHAELNGRKLTVSKDTLHVLVRRLFEMDCDYDDEDNPCSLASGICETLGIELI